jgi:hypothetical protein
MLNYISAVSAHENLESFELRNAIIIPEAETLT